MKSAKTSERLSNSKLRLKRGLWGGSAEGSVPEERPMAMMTGSSFRWIRLSNTMG